jgi:hypothetical protein
MADAFHDGLLLLALQYEYRDRKAAGRSIGWGAVTQISCGIPQISAAPSKARLAAPAVAASRMGAPSFPRTADTW